MYKIFIFIFSGILFIGCSQKITTETTGWEWKGKENGGFQVIETFKQKEKREKKEAKAAKKKAKKDKRKFKSEATSWEYYNSNGKTWEYTTPCSDCPEIVIK